MRETHPIRWMIGIICMIVLAVAIAIALFLDSRSPDPVLGIFKPKAANSATLPPVAPMEDQATAPTQATGGAPSSSSGTALPPQDLPPSVNITPEKDPSTGENLGISFPCQVPEYGLVIEKLDPYSGMYVEDGSNVYTPNVAMLLVENNGDYPVEYTQIRVMYGQEELLFDISALPVGQSLVVQEKSGKVVPEGKADSATALVVQRAQMDMSEDMVQVTDNGNNTLTITNLTDATIPTVRVFYKYYMEDQDIFVGGIAFTVRITRLGAGASMTVQPAHYTSETSRVVMVLTYDSEV